MKYIKLDENNIAAEIIPAENPKLPGVDISDRYSPEFLERCVPVQDDIEVSMGWVYDRQSKRFGELEPSVMTA